MLKCKDIFYLTEGCALDIICNCPYDRKIKILKKLLNNKKNILGLFDVFKDKLGV